MASPGFYFDASMWQPEGVTTTEKKNPIGPTGERVQRNVERIRTARKLSKAELSVRTGKAGRLIPPLGISRIEAGTRRVDADDLVALALALNVSPATLLLPPTANDDEVKLTPDKTVMARTAWAWATAQQTAMDDEPEPTLDLGDGAMMYTELESERRQAFNQQQENYLLLAQPEEIRHELSRGEGHRAVRTARDLLEAIRSLVAPEFNVGPAAVNAVFQAKRNRGVRRLYTALGLELDEVEEHLPPVHLGVPIPGEIDS
jgi:transcriptional regulator with XRE-family HTH domain